MTTLRDATAIGILALILPVAALANVTGTQTLTAGQTLSLDTGAVGTSGGDILWAGTGISMQGNAAELNLTANSGYNGPSQLFLLDASQLTQFGSYSSSPIPLSALVVNN